MNSDPVIVEETYASSPAVIWSALTNSAEMRQWYFAIADFKPTIGFEFSFKAGRPGSEMVHLCRVAEVVRERKIAYSWCYDGVTGNSLVAFELIPEGETTRVRVTHSGLETFPKSNPDLAKENFVEGWTAILGESLKNYLEAKPV
ncbi:SRPBCC domain-containing protein [bacterium]|nr:SRPBCC domain-containing protein [bacterium]